MTECVFIGKYHPTGWEYCSTHSNIIQPDIQISSKSIFLDLNNLRNANRLLTAATFILFKLYALSAITRRWYLFIKAGFKPGLDSGQK
jgi:hypothetical protein